MVESTIRVPFLTFSFNRVSAENFRFDEGKFIDQIFHVETGSTHARSSVDRLAKIDSM